jgi:hypothetical protein
MTIEPANAKKAIEHLYAASRELKLTAAEHEMHRTCRDGLMEFADEAGKAAEIITAQDSQIQSLKNVVRQLEPKP